MDYDIPVDYQGNTKCIVDLRAKTETIILKVHIILFFSCIRIPAKALRLWCYFMDYVIYVKTQDNEIAMITTFL